MTQTFKTNLFRIVSLALVFAASSGYAQKQHTLEVGGGISYNFLGKDWGFGDGLALDGYIGMRCSCGFGAEITSQVFSDEQQNGTLTIKQYAINGLYHFNNQGVVRPYLSLGWGQWNADVDYKPNFLSVDRVKAGSTFGSASVGLKIFPSRQFIIRPALKYLKSTENRDFDITSVGVGLAYSW